MKNIEVRGHSDDTFMVYGDGIDCDHDDCAAGKTRVVQLQGEGGRMLVLGRYGSTLDGVWFVGIAQVKEDDRFPDWPMTWSFEGYSPVLRIQAPDDIVATLVLVDP